MPDLGVDQSLMNVITELAHRRLAGELAYDTFRRLTKDGVQIVQNSEHLDTAMRQREALMRVVIALVKQSPNGTVVVKADVMSTITPDTELYETVEPNGDMVLRARRTE